MLGVRNDCCLSEGEMLGEEDKWEIRQMEKGEALDL